MSARKYDLSFYGLIFWILSSTFCGSNAALRTLYAEELCYGSSSARINLRFQNSAIISSVPNGPLDCLIRLDSEPGSSIVIAFNRYSLGSDDSLVFQDRNNFQLSLIGEGIFPDERKSLFFESPLSIHYVTNNTHKPDRLKFQLVFTRVYESPCLPSHFKCSNNKCIPNELACDMHNHCGDINDKDNCKPKDNSQESEVRVRTSNAWIITIIVCGVILGIVIIVFVAMLIRGCVLKKKKAQKPQLPTTATAPEVQQVPPPPSVFNRIRQSFRSVRHPTAPPAPIAAAPEQTADNYEVPSMYPNLPSAPNFHGVDNPEFKVEE